MGNCVYILMGVSGSGKTTIAKELLKRHDVPYIDGDYLHPRANIIKMSGGNPLNDDDRDGWLSLINSAVFAMQRTNSTSVIVCSALKKKYRDKIRESNSNLKFIFLNADFESIYKRLEARVGHFQKPQMLVSQFEALEVPDESEKDVYTVSADRGVDEIIRSITDIFCDQNSASALVS